MGNDAMHVRAVVAHLGPAGAAMVAAAAAFVVKHDHPVADFEAGRVNTLAKRGDDAAGLMPGDDCRIGGHAAVFETFETQGFHDLGRPAAIEMQVASAHARGLHLDDRLAGSRRRIVKFQDFEFPVASEDYPAHDILQ